MVENILELIEGHETIIIHRHKQPDLDAYGSQLGFREILKDNFPHKKIYVVGDQNRYPFDATMDHVEDKDYKNALVFILDTAEKTLVSDERYKQAHKLVVIDHHLNDTNTNPDIFISWNQYISCSEIIVDLALKWGLKLNQLAANHLYAGIIGDSGRFQYVTNRNAKHVFDMTAELMKYDVDILTIYDFLYLETLEKRRIKQMFADFKLTNEFVAYRMNDLDIIKKSGLDFASVSRGTINLMAGIEEVYIWANFTEKENGEIIGEFRSRQVSIVDIAKRFGGGGHAQACGATLKSFDQAHEVIEAFNERMKEFYAKKNI